MTKTIAKQLLNKHIRDLSELTDSYELKSSTLNEVIKELQEEKTTYDNMRANTFKTIKNIESIRNDNNYLILALKNESGETFIELDNINEEYYILDDTYIVNKQTNKRYIIILQEEALTLVTPLNSNKKTNEI